MKQNFTNVEQNKIWGRRLAPVYGTELVCVGLWAKRFWKCKTLMVAKHPLDSPFSDSLEIIVDSLESASYSLLNKFW